MTREEEIALVVAVLEAPAGYDLDLFGGMLQIRSAGAPFGSEESIEVEWEETEEKLIVRSFPKGEVLAAATFFVEKRHERRLGLDFEREVEP